MLNIGAGELAIILVVALLVLGPQRLPELARGIGKFMREFRRQTDEVRSTLEGEFYKMDQELLREETPSPKRVVPEPDDAAQAQARPQPALDAGGVTSLPPIRGPLDGGRRVADELLPRTQVAEPASAEAPAPDSAPAPADPEKLAQLAPEEETR